MPIRKKTGIPIPKAVPADAARAAAAPVSHPVPYIKQLKNQWCWAVCTAMIGRFVRPVDPELKQCELANTLLGKSNCCNAPTPAGCNQPCPIGQIIPVYNTRKILGVFDPKPLPATGLLKELTNHGPVEVGYLWWGGGGHVAVVYGLNAAGLFAVHDPWFGSGFVAHDSLLLAYGQGRWAISFGRFRAEV